MQSHTLIWKYGRLIILETPSRTILVGSRQAIRVEETSVVG
jgi:hypothetical protein